MGTVVYLAGTMAGKSRKEMSEWRYDVQCKFNKVGIGVINPVMYSDVNNVALYDKRNILNSDYVLALVTEISAGTMMELLWAYHNNKRIVVVRTCESSTWIDLHSDKIVSSLKEGVDWVINDVKSRRIGGSIYG